MPGLLDTESIHTHTHTHGIQPQGGSEDKAKSGGEWAEQFCVAAMEMVNRFLS